MPGLGFACYPKSGVSSQNKKNIKLGWRVLINLSGHYYSPNDPKYIRIVENEGNTSGMRGVICETREEAENHYSILTSELYRFFNDSQKTSGFNTVAMQFPYLNPNKKYSNVDIYNIFKISEDEISFIKKYVNNCDKNKKSK
jgi:hypothetical protein